MYITLDHPPGFEDLAHFRWPVSVQQTIAARPSQIWQAISRPGNLADCHPFCEKNRGKNWPGVAARDVIHYGSGWVYQRDFVRWQGGVGYDLWIGRPGGKKSFVSWRIVPEPENTGMLKIMISPHILQNIPAALRWLPHRKVVQPQLTRYREAVVSGFAWFIETGKAVTRNQFGTHPWFSRKGVEG